MKQEFLLPEDNIDSALFLYVYLGIKPGSFTTWIIYGDLERARMSAHPMLRMHKLDIIKLMYERVRLLPKCCIDSNFKNWNGFKYLAEDEKGMFLTELKLKGLDATHDKIVEAERVGIM